MATLCSLVLSGRAGYAFAAVCAAMTLTACRSDLTAPATTAGGTGPTVVQAGATSSANPLSSFMFYVDHASSAQQTADAWRSSRPSDAQQMDKIASEPVAKWFGSWNTIGSIAGDVASAVSNIASTGRVPVFVAYNISHRDCGGLSGSNTLSDDGYRSWIGGFARGLGDANAVVILEPDALAAMDCLSSADQGTRVDLLRYAVDAITADANARVYLDAGNPTWQPAATMATRLTNAGLAKAAGFSLNVSNFFYDGDNVAYGSKISALTGGKHFIIDSGRNGLGPTADNQWCNPAGRAIGRRPTTNTGNPLVDAFLWVKTPGESDGACNGAPAAGQWMPEYALGLASRG